MHWDYEPKRKDEISVKKGDTVTMVDHHRSNTNKETKRVRNVHLYTGTIIMCITIASLYYCCLPSLHFSNEGRHITDLILFRLYALLACFTGNVISGTSLC